MKPAAIDTKRIADLFEAVVEMPAGERARYLADACRGDEQLKAEVWTLLRAHDARPGSLDADVDATGGGSNETTAAGPRMAEGPGARIGPYKLLQQIGEGGFGAVFMAEQETPVRRRVALKIIKLGMDTRQVIARFEAERQALALMDHPHIAKVLDAGATETGRPYFVMELCTGDPITAYCDREHLSIDERLGLFVDVCQAVQHAHQKGVIHRDIKPSNVLVATVDGKPQVKVIDFGIAKATASRLTEKTLFTEHKQLIGTPQYMSPEQAEGSLDIDTRTDVYSLGVLLYELLTGVTPFDAKSLRAAAYQEIIRIIREVEPARPSTRLSGSTDTLPSVAAGRRTEPRRLSSIIRGDLDWIVMKALEKDRARRYETANGLAADIQRHLSGEAVVAAPPSKAYRASKFVRKHRFGVAAVSAVITALGIGVAGFAWQAKQAALERDKALIAQKVADEERNRAESVMDFVTESLRSQDPGHGGRPDMTVVEAMRKASKRLESGDLADQPLTRSRLLSLIGEILVAAGKPAEAEPLMRLALEIDRKSFGGDHNELVHDLYSLAGALDSLGKHEESERASREAVEMARRVLPDDHKRKLIALHQLGLILSSRGRYAEAESAFQEAAEIAERRWAANTAEKDEDAVADTQSGLAMARWKQGKSEQAEAGYRKVIETYRRINAGDHPDTANSLNNLSVLYRDIGRLREAEELSIQAVEMWKRLYPQGHLLTARCMGNLGLILNDLGRPLEGEKLFRDALEIEQKELTGDHLQVASSMSSLAVSLLLQKKTKEAHSLNESALGMRRRLFTGDHPDLALSLNNCSVTLRETDRAAEAEPLVREALAMYQRLHANDHPSTANTFRNLGLTLAKLDRIPEALAAAREASEMAARIRPEPVSLRKKCDDALAQIERLAKQATSQPAASRPD